MTTVILFLLTLALIGRAFYLLGQGQETDAWMAVSAAFGCAVLTMLV